MIPYSIEKLETIETQFKNITIFENENDNIDKDVVKSFGDEWSSFNEFDDEELDLLSTEYFDIIEDGILNKDSYCLDAGCGTGRYTKVLHERVKFFEAVDPSEAIFAANKVLKNANNVRLTKASIGRLPFDDEVFDFVMSIGVLHHIPDTHKAMQSCVNKLKKGGYFYVYLYYALDNRNPIFKLVYNLSVPIRWFTSSLPFVLKKQLCLFWAITLYMPLILLGRLLNFIGLNKIANQLPLSSYQNKSFFIIRNDALDRFGTSLEQRFSKKQIQRMMSYCGLTDIKFSDQSPYWHAIGKKK